MRFFREGKGLSLPELAALVKIEKSLLAKKERGEVGISPPQRKAIAKALGMSLDEFDAHWRASKIDRTKGGPGIPVINRAPAGGVIDYEEYSVDSGQGFEYLDWGDVTDDLAFAVIVVGDSMEPVLQEGDFVVLSPMTVPKPAEKLENGDIVFVRFGPDSEYEGCTLAYWHYEPQSTVITLAKANPKYPPLMARGPEIQQVAVMVEFRRRAKRRKGR